MFSLNGFFTKEILLRTLKDLPPLKTTVMDTVFTNRPKHPFPIIRADDYMDVLQSTPLIRRGGMPVQVSGAAGSRALFEPFSLNPMDQVSGAQINDLSALGGESLAAWRTAKTDKLRRIVRASTEGMCAAAISGTLSWPTAVENGYENYQVQFGTILSHTAVKKISVVDATLKDLIDILRAMKKKITAKGYGSKTVTWAGGDVFSQIMALALAHKSDAKLQVQVMDGAVNIGGYVIAEMDETYTPPGGAATPKVAVNHLVMIALDANHTMPYCAIDDLDGKLQPLPFFIKPVQTKIPSGYALVAESKPFPMININGICKCVAI